MLKNKNVNVRLLGGDEPSFISPTDTPSMKAISRICQGMYDMSAPVPFVVMGGTDARHYQIVTDQIYRFSPFVMPPDILMLAHGTNERIAVDSLADGVVFFKRYVRAMAGDEA